MNARIQWEVMPEEDPVLGPPEPLNCPEGVASHAWQLSIEEGRIVLLSDCRFCTNGIREAEPEEFQMGEIAVRLTFHHETHGYYEPEHVWWWEIVP